jgi:hypothetical protein
LGGVLEDLHQSPGRLTEIAIWLGDIIVKSRVELLGVLVLLPWALVSPTLADSEDANGESTPEATEPEVEITAPDLEPRTSPIMGELIFDHVAHVEDMEIECDECHHETNAVPLDYPHAEYFDDLWIDCGTCHHESGSANPEPRSCYDCHDARSRDVADESLSPKVILHKNCWKCHEVETGREASESCELCHSG